MSSSKRGKQTMATPGAKTARTTVNTTKDAARFSKAAASFAKKARASKKVAHRTLVSLGIYTASGKLSKNYK
jgi:hypothetical protein